MIAVSVKRTYPGATRFGTDEKGVLRVYEGDEVIAQYAPGEAVTVSQEAMLSADSPDVPIGAF